MTDTEFTEVMAEVRKLWPDLQTPNARITRLWQMFKVFYRADVMPAVRSYLYEHPDEDRPRKLWRNVLEACQAAGREDDSQGAGPLNVFGHSRTDTEVIVKQLRTSRHPPTQLMARAHSNDEALYTAWVQTIDAVGFGAEAHWRETHGRYWEDEEEWQAEGLKLFRGARYLADNQDSPRVT